MDHREKRRGLPLAAKILIGAGGGSCGAGSGLPSQWPDVSL